MTSIPNSAVVDPGKVRLGAGCRSGAVSSPAASITPVPPAAVADPGKVRLG